MAVSGFMKIKGQRQGEITKGASSKESVGNQYLSAVAPPVGKGVADYIQVLGSAHTVELMIDPVSGQASGRRQHKPFVITKMWDKTTPLLYQAACQNEELEVEIYWYRPNPKGELEHYFTHVLKEAQIVSIRSNTPQTTDVKQAYMLQMDEVALSYGKIEWRQIVAKTEASDDWRAVAT